MRTAIWLATDLLLVVLAAGGLVILVTGGGALTVWGHELSLLRARNSFTAALLLSGLRFGVAPEVPFLRLPSLQRDPLTERCARAGRAFHRALEGLTPQRARLYVAVGLVLSLALKVGNAWHYPGFPYADGAEIHAMTFSALQGTDLGVWNIRGGFFPMAFIYPPQRLLWELDVRDPFLLVFAGRLVVVAFSLLNLWLVYQAGRRTSSLPVAMIAFGLLAVSRLHNRLGSTELPRTLATTFLLAGFLLLVTRRGAGAATAAGACLGVGAALRFGEAVFVAPFAAHLVLERRYRELAVGLVAAAVGALAVLGPGDLLFWPQMFSSLRHVVDFSLRRRMSSSGYNAPWDYARIAPEASDFVTIGLFLWSLKLRPGRAALWCILPVALLSFFQRKEERYLLPALPFFLLCAARGAWDLLERTEGRPPGRRHVLTLLALAGAVLLELEGFRSRDGGVGRLFRTLNEDSALRDVAMEKGTEAGARLYLPPRVHVLTLDSERLREASFLWGVARRAGAQYVVLRRGTERDTGAGGLLAKAGYAELSAEGTGDYRVFRRAAGPEP